MKNKTTVYVVHSSWETKYIPKLFSLEADDLDKSYRVDPCEASGYKRVILKQDNVVSLNPTAAWTNYKLRKTVERTVVSRRLAKLTDDIAAADEALALLVEETGK